MSNRPAKKPQRTTITEITEKDLRLITLKPSQQKYLNQILTNDITFCYGPAGTSKTFTACLAALNLYDFELNSTLE